MKKLSESEIKAIRENRGAAARVARKCNVNPSLVSRVLSGQRTGLYQKKTAQVIEALRAECRQLQAKS